MPVLPAYPVNRLRGFPTRGLSPAASPAPRTVQGMSIEAVRITSVRGRSTPAKSLRLQKTDTLATPTQQKAEVTVRPIVQLSPSASSHARTQAKTMSSKGNELVYSCTTENNGNMVAKVLDSLGGRRASPDERPSLDWCELRCHVDFEAVRMYSTLTNHILMLSIVWKTGMLRSVKEHCRRSGKVFPPAWFPLTFNLPHDQELFEKTAYARGGRWICKPACENRGRGIFLVDLGTPVSGAAEEAGPRRSSVGKPRSDTRQQMEKRLKRLADVKGVVQKYIDKPLLCSDQRKFDLRMYLLVARTSPLLVFFRPGYVRRCLVPYSNDNCDDLFAHLTNNSLQKHAANYKEEAEDTIWDMERWAIDVGLGVDGLESTMAPAMRQASLDLVHGCSEELRSSPYGTFSLLGLDFMYDAQFRPYLLEVNTNPALWTNTEVLAQVVPTTIREALEIVLWAHGAPGSSSAEPRTGFSVVLDETK